MYFNTFFLGESESEGDSSEDEKKRKKPKKSRKKKKRKSRHKSKKRLVIICNCVRIELYSSQVGQNFLAHVMYFTKLGLKKLLIEVLFIWFYMPLWTKLCSLDVFIEDTYNVHFFNEFWRLILLPVTSPCLWQWLTVLFKFFIYRAFQNLLQTDAHGQS